jgi:hypothetical protein
MNTVWWMIMNDVPHMGGNNLYLFKAAILKNTVGCPSSMWDYRVRVTNVGSVDG